MLFRVDVITIFPDIIKSYINQGILKKAIENDILSLNVHNLRDWTQDKHRTVDDRVYGGGAGMLLKASVIFKALNDIVDNQRSIGISDPKIVVTSAFGDIFTQNDALNFAKISVKKPPLGFIILCGRYEGFDSRVLKIADYNFTTNFTILTGGEIPALIIIDSITRLLPGVLGNYKSPNDETEFTINKACLKNCIKRKAEYPQYTRPEVLKVKHPKTKEPLKLKVPKILLSGDHKKIKDWQTKKRMLL